MKLKRDFNLSEHDKHNQTKNHEKDSVADLSKDLVRQFGIGRQ